MSFATPPQSATGEDGAREAGLRGIYLPVGAPRPKLDLFWNAHGRVITIHDQGFPTRGYGGGAGGVVDVPGSGKGLAGHPRRRRISLPAGSGGEPLAEEDLGFGVALGRDQLELAGGLGQRDADDIRAT